MCAVLVYFIFHTGPEKVNGTWVFKIKTRIVLKEISRDLTLKITFRHANNRTRVLSSRSGNEHAGPKVIVVESIDETIC